MNHSVRRVARVLSLAALALCLVAPAAAEARTGPAAADPELHVAIGGRCVAGIGFLAKDTVRLTHRRGSKTLTDVTFKTTSDEFDRCLAKPVAIGDTVRFVRSVGTKVKQQRTFAVPDLRITGDLGANTLTIDVFVNGAPLTTYVGMGAVNTVAGTYTHGLGTAAILDANGHSVVNMGDYAWTLMTGDAAYTAYSTANDDMVFRWWAPPTMTAQAGKPTVFGTGVAGANVTLTLKTAGGATRSSVTAKAGPGLVIQMDGAESAPWYLATFAKSGSPVTAKAGNVIVSSRMDPDGATVRANDFKATAGGGDATLTGTCNPDSHVVIGDGVYSVSSFDTPSGDIDRSDLIFSSGDKVTIGCQTPDGYGQRFVITVP